MAAVGVAGAVGVVVMIVSSMPLVGRPHRGPVRAAATAGCTPDAHRSASAARQRTVKVSWPAGRPADAPAVLAVDARPAATPSVDWTRTGGDDLQRVALPEGEVTGEDDLSPTPSRTTTRAPPPAAVSDDRDRLRRPARACGSGRREPLRTARSAQVRRAVRSRAGRPTSSRTSAITAATSTDQFGPPRVRADRAGDPGQLGLEDPARVDRGVGVALVVGRQQRRRRRRPSTRASVRR